MAGSAIRKFWNSTRRAPAPPVMPDPADLGTAFGMEVVLDQSAYTPPLMMRRTIPAPWWKRLHRDR